MELKWVILSAGKLMIEGKECSLRGWWIMAYEKWVRDVALNPFCNPTAQHVFLFRITSLVSSTHMVARTHGLLEIPSAKSSGILRYQSLIEYVQ